MSGQSCGTKNIVSLLEKEGWNIIFKCLPNTPHLGVIPIPVSTGTSLQRYPDICATKNKIIKLIEVEIKDSLKVRLKTEERFVEQTKSLNNKEIFQKWRKRVSDYTKSDVSETISIECELWILQKPKKPTLDNINDKVFKIFYLTDYLS